MDETRSRTKQAAQHGALDEREVDPNPIEQFKTWLAAAEKAGCPEPTAMTLATATAESRPSARMILLKGVDARGFVFFTNYESGKSAELEANPRAALLSWWYALQRQVRVEGRIERVSGQESDAYFRSRPARSQLAAIVSPQSRVIESREELVRRVDALAEELGADEPARPAYWGGYRLDAESIEFWQGRPDRLHDRLRYTRGDDAAWTIERLAP